MPTINPKKQEACVPVLHKVRISDDLSSTFDLTLKGSTELSHGHPPEEPGDLGQRAAARVYPYCIEGLSPPIPAHLGQLGRV